MIIPAYLGILGEVIEGSDVKLEFSGLGKLAKANPETEEVVSTNIFSTF